MIEELNKAGITTKIYTKGDDIDLLGIIIGESEQVGTFKSYGDPNREEFMTVDNMLGIRAKRMVQQTTELIKDFTIEFNKKWDPEFKKFHEVYDMVVLNSFPPVIKDLIFTELTHEDGPFKGDVAKLMRIDLFVPDKKGRYSDDKGVAYRPMTNRELQIRIDEIEDYFEKMGLPKPEFQTISTGPKATDYYVYMGHDAWAELFVKQKQKELLSNYEITIAENDEGEFGIYDGKEFKHNKKIYNHNTMISEFSAEAEAGQAEILNPWKYKPQWKYLDENLATVIEEKLNDIGFINGNTWEQKNMIDRMWDGIERYNLNKRAEIYKSDLSADEKAKKVNEIRNLTRQQKEEFYFMMYEKYLAWEYNDELRATEQDVKDGLAEYVGGPVREFSMYAIKDMARDILSPEKFENGGIAGLLTRAIERGDSEAEQNLKDLLSFADQVLHADESLEDNNAFVRLIKSVIGNKWSSYIPFYGSYVGITDAQRLKKASDAVMNGTASPEEHMMMSMYKLQTMIDGIEERHGGNAGMWGRIMADMFPYMGEFWATGGVYTTTQKNTSKWLTEKLYSSAFKNGRVRYLQPYHNIFGHNVQGLKLAENVNSVLSWLAGTLAQSTANPQNYIKHMIERMTPGMKWSMSDRFDDKITAEELKLIQFQMDVEDIEVKGTISPISQLRFEQGSWEGNPIPYIPGDDEQDPGVDNYFYIDEETDTLYQYNAKKDKYKKVSKYTEYYKNYLEEQKEVDQEPESLLPADFDISVYEGMTIHEVLQYNTENFEKEQSDYLKKELVTGVQYTSSVSNIPYTYKGNVEWDGILPEGMGEAFIKAYGLNWAEFSTERLGEFLPGALKYMTKGQLEGLGEYIRRATIGRLSARLGVETSEELLSVVISRGMGYHGLLAEVFEETVNQSLSSMILGRDWNEAFLDQDGNWDSKWFVEMGGAMTITSLLFTGGNAVQVIRDQNKPNYK